MAVLGRELGGSYTTVISTGANSLADDGGVSSATQTPSGSAVALTADIAVTLASLTPTGTPTVELHILVAADDTPTNFADEGEDTLVAVLPVTTSTGAKYKVARDVTLPNREYKVRLVNKCGVSLAASGNTVAIGTGREESA